MTKAYKSRRTEKHKILPQIAKHLSATRLGLISTPSQIKAFAKAVYAVATSPHNIAVAKAAQPLAA